jgi:hypothetical protein
LAVNDLIAIVVVLILAIFGVFILPAWMIKRNARKVIAIFQQNNAIGIKNAKTALELGINRRSLLQNIGRLRDYKPKALEFLIQAGVVSVTEDEKLYITEQSLANITWLKQDYTQY